MLGARDQAIPDPPGFELREGIAPMIQVEPQIPHQVKPRRTPGHWHEQVEVDGIAREPEKNHRVTTNEQEWQLLLRCTVPDG